MVNINYSDKSLKCKNNTLKIIIAIFFLLNTYLFADSIYTEAELKELKVFFAKEESDGNRKWIKGERKRRSSIPYDIGWRKKFIKYFHSLENIKESDIQVEKTEKNLVIISYPTSANFGDEIERKESAYYKKGSQWIHLYRNKKVDFLYLDEDEELDLIGFESCCDNISIDAVLSTDEYESKKIRSSSVYVPTFKVNYGKCYDFRMEGKYLNNPQNDKTMKFTFDCKEKKFKEVKSFFDIFLNWF